MDLHIQHLTMASGHLSTIASGDVSGETLARVRPWLGALAACGASMPLPLSGLQGYVGLAAVLDGAALFTVSGPPIGGKAPPLVTLGVATTAAQGELLWPLLTGPVMPASKRGLKCPAAPWCAAVIWPTLALHPGAAAWLGDLERCIAWAWVTRPGRRPRLK